MLRRFLSLTLFWLAIYAAGLALAAFALPALYDWMESWRHSPLVYEEVLRLAIGFAYVVILLGALAWVVMRGAVRHFLLWLAFAASGLILAVVFIFDPGHKLMEEFSWIRYPSGGFLFLAALAALGLVWHYWRQKPRPLTPLLSWLVLAGGFAFAGADELFEIHEKTGRVITRLLHISGEFTDYITIAYGLAALAVLIILARLVAAELRKNQFSLILFFLGAASFILATAFDTIDKFLIRKLETVANVLSINPKFVFSDVWQMIYWPREFLNGNEEVLEMLAALLFFAAAGLALLEKHYGSLDKPLAWRRGRIIRRTTILAAAFFVVAPITLSLPYLSPRSVLTSDKGRITPLANYFDGLYHADDLDFNPNWGVIIGNEGGSSVYQWKGNRWYRLPDPERKLRDPDSVLATAGAVYVADGSQQTIFRYQKNTGWQALWTKKDGLKHPEGLTTDGKTLYVIDNEKTIVKLEEGKAPLRWKPNHPDWQAGEGIVYSPATNDFLVTDDKSGAIFRVRFNQSIIEVAKLSNPEDIELLADGSALITDNGWGAIYKLAPDNTVKKLYQFQRNYHDLQGITADSQGNIYVVTADGPDSASFMPSFLFQIKVE